MKNGGSAFPIIKSCIGEDGKWLTSHEKPGMSMRDFFAGQALAGINHRLATTMSVETIAQGCYALADAMLAEREK